MKECCENKQNWMENPVNPKIVLCTVCGEEHKIFE